MADVVQAILTATDKNYTSTMQKAMGVTDSFASKLKSGVGFGAWVAIGTKAVNTVFNAIGNGVDGAVKRFDTLNNFPKVMQSLGFEAEDAQKGIDKLADGIDHLPTTLDAVASQAQQFVPMTGNIAKATDVTLALNNAMAAGGKDAATQQRAIEQWTKAMAKGKPDFEMWQSMVQTAPAQMDQLAKAMLGASANQNDLYEGMKSGAVSIEEVNDKMIELTNASEGFDIAGKHYDNFAEQAKNASAGIGMAMVNTNAAVQRNIEKIIRSFDKKLGGGKEGGLVAQLMKIPDVIDAIGGKITEKIDGITDLKSAFATLASGVGAASLAVTMGAATIGPSLGTIGGMATKAGKKVKVFGKDFKAGFVTGLQEAGAKVPTLLSGIASKFSAFTGVMGKGMSVLGTVMKVALSALAPAVLIGGIIAGIGLLATSFGDEINRVIETIKTQGPQIITSLGEGITSRLPELMSKGAEVLTGFIQAIAANIPAIIQQGTQIITTLVQGATAALPQLLPAAMNALGQFLIGIATALPQLIPAGLQFIVTLVQGISQNLPQLLQAALTAIVQFGIGIVQNLPTIIQCGLDILQALVRGIISGITQIPAAVKSIFGAIKEAITGNKSELETSGQEQGQALIDNVATSATANQSVVQSAGTDTGLSFGTGLNTALSSMTVDVSAMQSSLSAIAPAAQTEGQNAGTQFGTGLQSVISGINVDTSAVTAPMEQAAPQAQSAGTQVGTQFGAGMKSAQGQVQSASQSLAQAATSSLRNGYSKAYSAGAYISQGMAAGMRSCLGQIRSAAAAMSAAADEAMRAKAKVSSPSKVTKKTGGYIGLGLVMGILGKVKDADKAGKKIVGSMLNVMEGAANSANFTAVADKVGEKVKKTINAKLKTVDSSFSKAYKKLDKNKTATKTLKKLQKKIDKAYSNAISSTEKKLDNLAKTYQDKYDAIIRAQEDFANRLGSVDLFKSKNGNVIFADFTAEQKKIEALSSNLEKLKKILPQGLMDEIVSMDTADALKYTTAMLQMTEEEIKSYGQTYTNMQNAASKASSAFYSDRIAEVKSQYVDAVEKEFASLKSKLGTIGQQAVSGFIKGMKKDKKQLDSTTQQLVNSVVKAAKKKLKIKSPSKVFEQIGAYTGEGFAIGLDKTQRDVQASIDNMLQAADFNRNMANNRFNGSLSDEYDYNIAARYEIVVPLEVNGREFARATADDMQAVINQKETYTNRKKGIR